MQIIEKKGSNSNIMNCSFSNTEIVAIAVYLLGGTSAYIDTEDIAVKANELAPGRFTWKKYKDQINIYNVRKGLWDGKNSKKGGYILGSHIRGWMLSKGGLKFCKSRIKDLEANDLARLPISQKELNWKTHEKRRMLSCAAYEKVIGDRLDELTKPELEEFFRVDDYIIGEARERKLTRIVNIFDEDPEVGSIIKVLYERIRKNDRVR